MDRERFQKQAAEFGLSLQEEQCGGFERYLQQLLEWNEKMNLTAITEPDEVMTKHFLDSLLVFAAAEIPQNAAVIDIGTGAGFPGVPMKLYRSDLQMTLLDSLNKRLLFLDALCKELGLEAKLLHQRAEEGGRSAALREKFDIAVSRAVAALPELCEYCLPYVKKGGLFLALKGLKAEEELEAAQRAISVLGGKLEEKKTFSLPDGSSRTLLLIRKISQTPAKYPRTAAKMAKEAL